MLTSIRVLSWNNRHVCTSAELGRVLPSVSSFTASLFLFCAYLHPPARHAEGWLTFQDVPSSKKGELPFCATSPGSFLMLLWLLGFLVLLPCLSSHSEHTPFQGKSYRSFALLFCRPLRALLGCKAEAVTQLLASQVYACTHEKRRFRYVPSLVSSPVRSGTATAARRAFILQRGARAA